MKHDLDLSQLYAFLETQGVLLSVRQREQVAAYVKLLKVWGNKINLVSGADYERLIERHVLVSFYYVYLVGVVERRVKGRLLDLGSGAGFPGVLFSVCFPETYIRLLDSSRKKYLFLKNVIKDLGLAAVPVCNRAEGLETEDGRLFDVVLARAVAPLDRLDKLVKPLVRKRGLLYTLKGDGYRKEYKAGAALSGSLVALKVEDVWKRQSSYFDGKVMIKMEY